MVSASGRYSVVVADDSPDTRLMLRLSIERAGDLEVIAEAADGEEAVELVLRHMPDVALVDLRMPKLDGLAAVARMHDGSPETRVVVISGLSADNMRDAAIASGARDYIEKGCPLSELTQRIRSLCVPEGDAPP